MPLRPLNRTVMYKDAHILARLVKEGGLEDQFGHQAVFNLQCDVEPIIRGLYEKATKKTPGRSGTV